jgi:hypothetical protein
MMRNQLGNTFAQRIRTDVRSSPARTQQLIVVAKSVFPDVPGVVRLRESTDIVQPVVVPPNDASSRVSANEEGSEPSLVSAEPEADVAAPVPSFGAVIHSEPTHTNSQPDSARTSEPGRKGKAKVAKPVIVF